MPPLGIAVLCELLTLDRVQAEKPTPVTVVTQPPLTTLLAQHPCPHQSPQPTIMCLGCALSPLALLTPLCLSHPGAKPSASLPCAPRWVRGPPGAGQLHPSLVHAAVIVSFS